MVLCVDTGVDDVLALALLLSTPATIPGIIASYGNVSVETAHRNTVAALEVLAPHRDIPVWAGSTCPSWATGFIPDAGCAAFHGHNGLGNLDTAQYGATASTRDRVLPPNVGQLQTRLAHKDPYLSVGGYQPTDPYALPAYSPGEGEVSDHPTADIPEGVTHLIEELRTHGTDTVVVATGPLTDIDLTLRLAPDIAPRLRLVVMGGALHVPGNCYDAVAETNIIQDPEAALRICASGADVTFVGLDVTERCLLGQQDVSQWKESLAGQFLADLVAFSHAANAGATPRFASGMPLHDPLALAVALDPTLVTTMTLPITIQTQTRECESVRGRLVADYQLPHRVKVALEVDHGRFVTEFIERLGRY